MPNPDVAWSQAVPSSDDRGRQFTASLPMRTALLAVASVWVLGAVWSFTEQSAFAANKGFAFPHLLPLVIDGFAIAMAMVAWAASLDARPAVAARLATVIAVLASSASNGAWAYIRTNRDLVAVLLGVAVPIAANLAFEVLLAELRRQVQRRRGLPPPVAIPYPRLIRFGLAPFATFFEWRTLVLELTAMEHAVSRPEPAVPLPATAPGTAPAAARVEVPAEPAASRYVTMPAATPTTQAAPVTHAAPESRERPPAARPESPVHPEPVAHREPAPALVNGHRTATPVGPATPVAVGLTGTDRPVPGRRDLEAVPVALPGGGTNGSGAGRGTANGGAANASTANASAANASTANASTANASTANGTTTNGTTTNGTTTNGGTTNGTANGTTANGTTANGGASNGRAHNGQGPNGRSPNGRRQIDPRVEMLAAHLAGIEDGGEFTGEMVGPLLDIEVAPRTGRRLLGQARELLAERARADAERHETGLSVIGGRGGR